MDITITFKAEATDVCDLEEGDAFVNYDGDSVRICDYVTTVQGFTHVIYHYHGTTQQDTFAWPSGRMLYTIDLK